MEQSTAPILQKETAATLSLEIVSNAVASQAIRRPLNKDSRRRTSNDADDSHLRFLLIRSCGCLAANFANYAN
jgi:hypothetical protein